MHYFQGEKLPYVTFKNNDIKILRSNGNEIIDF